VRCEQFPGGADEGAWVSSAVEALWHGGGRRVAAHRRVGRFGARRRGRVEQGLQVGGGAWSSQARKEQGGWAMRGVRVGELLSEGEGRASVGGARRRKRSSAGELGGAASKGQVGRAGELLLSRCRAGGCC
jgi:hypothetical protein